MKPLDAFRWFAQRRRVTAWVVVSAAVLAGVVCGGSAHAALVGRWSFDTDLGDTSGWGNDFRPNDPPNLGNVELVPGRVGNAARFDGGSLIVNDSPGLVGQYESFTLGAYVFVESIPSGAGDASVLAAPGLAAGITYHVDQRFYGHAGDATTEVVSPAAVGAGAWRHVVQTYDGAARTTRLYVDGALVDATASQTPPASVNIGSLAIGRVGGASFLTGRVDEAFLFDEVLSDQQIAALADPAASEARFWITPSGAAPLSVPPGGLEVDLTPAEAGVTQRFDVWGRPESFAPGFFDRFSDITLNVTSSAPLVDFIDNTVVMHNPIDDGDGSPITPVVGRYTSVQDGMQPPNTQNPDINFRTLTAQEVMAGQSDAVRGLAGRNLTVSQGFGAVGFGGAGCAAGDPHCVMTPGGPAWRVASFGLQALPTTGTVDLRLQIGAGGMRHAGGLSAETDVIFAPPGVTEPSYNAGPSGDREAAAHAADAPELRIIISDRLVGDYNADGRVDAADYTTWRDRLGSTAPLDNRSPNISGPVSHDDYEAWRRNYGRPRRDAIPLVGDYNDDGLLDTADYTVWRDLLGTSQPLTNRSPGLSGPVSPSGYDAWRQGYGQQSAASLAIPEPATLTVCFAALAFTILRGRGRRSTWAIAFCLAVTTTPASPAATVQSRWETATSGAWTTAANWDPDGVPNNNVADTYEVTIDATGSDYTVTLGSSVTIDSLMLNSADATLVHSGGTLSLLGTGELGTGVFRLNGGTISGGTIQATGGAGLSVANNASNRLSGVTVSGDLDLAALDASLLIDSGLALDGVARLSNSSARMRFEGTQAVTGNAAFELTGDNTNLAIVGAGTLTLAPTVTVRGGTGFNPARIGSDPFGTNNGETKTLVNQGLIESTSGTILVNPTVFTNQGTLRANAGTTLRISSGTFTHRGDAVLSGTGTVSVPHFVNEAAVRPGNSPGILTINGDYMQTSDGRLEIEVGGTTPGTQYDRLVVTGAATLAGRLDAPLIDSYAPQIGDTITFLRAASVNGAFEVYNFPNPLPDPDNVAQRLVYTPTEARIEFLAPTPIEFVSPDQNAEWTTPADWLENGAPATPDSVNILNVSNNLAGVQTQTLTVVAPATPAAINAAHRLTVGDEAAPIVLRIDNTGLSTTTTTTVGANGAIELAGDSVFSSRAVEVTGGGRISGEGLVIGDVVVGASGVGEAILEAGVGGVGLLAIEGDFSQGSTAVMEADLLGITAGQHDKVEVREGGVQHGGTLRVNVQTAISAGDTFSLVTADTGSGAFAEIEVVDPAGLAAGLYPSPFYGSAAAAAAFQEGIALVSEGQYESGLRWLQMGDADGDGAINQGDAEAFAATLINSELQGYRLSSGRRAALNFVAGFDFFQDGAPEGIQLIDVDDIPGFLEAMAASQSISMASASVLFAEAYDRALDRLAVPEPGALGIAVIGLLGIAAGRRGSPFNS